MDAILEQISKESLVLAILLLLILTVKPSAKDLVGLFKLLSEGIRSLVKRFESDMQSKYFHREEKSDLAEISQRVMEILAWTCLMVFYAPVAVLSPAMLFLGISQQPSVKLIYALLAVIAFFLASVIFLKMGLVRTRDTVFELRHKTWRKK
jgi:hypothetical protein